jgi:hypothetical protein
LVEPVERLRGNVEADFHRVPLTELVGEHRQMVEQALSPRVHHREAGWVVVNAPTRGRSRGAISRCDAAER